MSTRRKPFYKKARNAWYVQFEGEYVKLLAGPNTPANRRAATELFEEMKVAQRKAERFMTPGVLTSYSLGRLYAEFLLSAFTDRADATRGFYEEKLAPFAAHLGEEFPADQLKPLHIEQWIAAHPHWKKGTARTVWQAVQRLMRWGEKSGRTLHSTICDYGKPGATRRTVLISPDEYRTVILANLRSPAFKDLVTVAWECGARPQEFLEAEARHYDATNQRIVFPPEESKGDQWPRIVYLSDDAVPIVERLVREHPTGKIFRNLEGGAWTNSSVNCEWVRLRHRLGYAKMRAEGIEPSEQDIAARIKTLKATKREGGIEREKTAAELREEARLKCRQNMASKLAPKYCLYHFRHSWLDRMLKKGVDVLTCAILMGHRDPSMIAKTYQHLSQSPDHLRAALNKRAAG